MKTEHHPDVTLLSLVSDWPLKPAHLQDDGEADQVLMLLAVGLDPFVGEMHLSILDAAGMQHAITIKPESHASSQPAAQFANEGQPHLHTLVMRKQYQ